MNSAPQDTEYPTECSGPPHLLTPVGFGRSGGGVSGLLMTPLSAGHLRETPAKSTGIRRRNDKGRPNGRPLSLHAMRVRLLDLRLAEFDVLLGDRVILLLDQLVGHGARVLLGHVVEAGVGARHELDLDAGGLGHGETSVCTDLAGTVAAGPEKSRISRRNEGPEAFDNLRYRGSRNRRRIGALAERPPDIEGQLGAIGPVGIAGASGIRETLQHAVSRIGEEALLHPCADGNQMEMEREAGRMAVTSDIGVFRPQDFGESPLRSCQ